MKLPLVALSFLSSLPLAAQMAVPPSGATPFKDTSAFKPPAGARLAIIEFEDLECPLCALSSPIVHAAMEHYRIPRVHHDFIIPSHTWSRTAAINARYLEDHASPAVAEDFRRDVFANQSRIGSRDDLFAFTRTWFQSHGQKMPFVIDPDSRCANEVQADCLLATRLGVLHTPTIIVATRDRWIEVTDPRQLNAAIDIAEASLKHSPKAGRPDITTKGDKRKAHLL
jgi:protein-disulfide isomerase